MQHFAEPLYRVHQQISFLDDALILSILEWRPVCFDNPMHLVDRAMQTARRNETRQLTSCRRLSECMRKRRVRLLLRTYRRIRR